MSDGRLPGPEPIDDLHADIDLFCPHCDYNLRGLTEDRCPECGNGFDRRELLHWLRTSALSVYSRGPHQRAQQFRLFWMSLFRPSRVGRELPPWIAADAAANYSLAMRSIGLIAAFFMFFAVPEVGSSVSIGILLWAPVIVFGTYFCEWGIASYLARWVEPLCVPTVRRYEFWRSLCHCFTSHFLVSCVAVPASAALVLRAGVPFSEWVLPGSAGIMLLWWCLGLILAVTARSSASPGRLAATLLIPVIALLSIGAVLAPPLIFLVWLGQALGGA